MNKSIKTVTARKSDYEMVFSVLVDTANWLNRKGSDQWSDLLRGVDVHKTDQAIENQNVYMVYDGNVLLGVFILLEEQSNWDHRLWGEDKFKNHAYLHRVALANSAHGKGKGKVLVHEAENVARKKEKIALRLDCIATNQYLNSFYSSIGFEMVEKQKPNEPLSKSLFNLYQKKL